MKNQSATQSRQSSASIKRAPYEAPAIIYEGLITTRAGSVLPAGKESSDGGGGGGSADPAQSFGGPG